MANVYVKLDGNNIVTDINSDVFLTSTTGWTKIDSGTTDKYIHAQNNYLAEGLKDMSGCYNYKYSGGAVFLRTSSEKTPNLPSTFSSVEKPTGEVWMNGKPIYTRTMEYNGGTGTGKVANTIVTNTNIDEMWIDNANSYIVINNNGTLTQTPLNKATTGNVGLYAIESSIERATNGTFTLNTYFGTSYTYKKYIKLTIKYYKVN